MEHADAEELAPRSGAAGRRPGGHRRRGVCSASRDINYVNVPDNIWSVTIFPTPEQLARIIEWPILIGAISIAFIASAETLLCATAVDQMHSGPRTKYDRELTAQGVGNTICGVLGVLPMTGVIVRSGANVEAGAETRAVGDHARRVAAAVRQRAAVHAALHPGVGAGGDPRLHRLQARLPEDRADAAQVRQEARCSSTSSPSSRS